MVYIIYLDGKWMFQRTQKGSVEMKNLKPEMGAEKITINLGAVEIGKIDILVENAYYTDRSDFIRNAIREKLKSHDSDIERITQSEQFADTTTRRSVFIGVMNLDKKDVVKMHGDGGKQIVVAVGLLVITGLTAEDTDLMLDVFDTIKVYGSLIMDSEIRAALEDNGILKTRKRRGDS